MKVCKELGCSRVVTCRGWCRSCYDRLRRGGRLVVAKHGRPLEERFFAKVDARGVCWQWTGGLVAGYGRFSIAPGDHYAAHRWCWEYLVGPIPDGLTLDHLCLNKGCVNPDHLEPVTRSENAKRAWRLRRGGRDVCPTCDGSGSIPHRGRG